MVAAFDPETGKLTPLLSPQRAKIKMLGGEKHHVPGSGLVRKEQASSDVELWSGKAEAVCCLRVQREGREALNIDRPLLALQGGCVNERPYF